MSQLTDLTFILCVPPAAILSQGSMSVHLGLSIDLSVYDCFLVVFALCLFLLLLLARQSAAEVGIRESAQPRERLTDSQDPPAADSPSVLSGPVNRLTYGQSSDIRDRARALAGDAQCS